MSLSIRNQLAGTVDSVTVGEAMATVKVRLDSGQDLVAAITADAAQELKLASGSKVSALVKATEVALATAPVSGLSIRNQLPGSVVDIATGPAMASVKVAVGGNELTAAITADAAGSLGLAPGSSVVALIKATEVALAAS